MTASADEPKVLRLGAGVNFGNMLEAPNEGEWGLKAEKEYFSLVKQAGFEHVRLPISWAHHVAKEAPFAINASFLSRVEELVNQALNANLKILVNYHHDHELNANPAANRERFLAIWKQIAERFQKYSNQKVAFELLNEPQDAFNKTPDVWNDLLAESLRIVRRTNPDRTVIVGPVHFNAIRGLPSLKLPEDRLLVVTVHYYDPFKFTHQGADWVKPAMPTGIAWDAKQLNLKSGWQNWSWDTQISGSTDGIRIEYRKGWAGLQAHSDAPRPKPLRLELKVAAAIKLKVRVGSGENFSEAAIQTEPGKSVKAEFAQSGAGESFDRLIVQCDNADPPAPFVIHELQLAYADKKESLFANAADSIRDDLKAASDWGARHGKTIYLGEFGAYQAADLESRVKWTTTVRTIAEELNFDWSYWEFAAGFGIYDPNKREFRMPLLEALRPVRIKP